MLMIICGHLIQMHSYDELFDESWYIGYSIYPFCVVAVDVFVLISGWFGIKLYYKKLLGINWMVTFYAVIILLFSLALGYKALNLRTDWMPFIPIITKQYWFITVYIVLCLISPFLNKLVEILDKRTFQKLLLILFVLFSLLPSAAFVFNFKSVTEDAGYGIVNFMFLYLLGRYLRLHYKADKSKYIFLLGFVSSMALLAIFQMVYSHLLGFHFDALLSNDTTFVHVGSVCLLLYFSKLDFTYKWINMLAAPCLAVYVIHFNPLFFTTIFNNTLHVPEQKGMMYVLYLLIVPVIIYITCAVVETIRKQLFKLIHIE